MSLYETAKYEVLEKEGKFEIREYEPYYTAAVLESDPVETYGFNQIFNYISGNNVSNEKISMTTPVLNELEQGQFTTEFVLPSKSTFNQLYKQLCQLAKLPVGRPAYKVGRNYQILYNR